MLKNNPYWLNGALIGLIIGIFPVIVFFINNQQVGGSYMFLVLPFMAIFILMSPVFHFLGIHCGRTECTVGIYVTILIGLIIHFLIGSFFGWLYGRKNKKSI